VPVAQGGTRGFAVLAATDGRLLISQSHEVDVLFPVQAPRVVSSNPPDGATASLPLGTMSVIFDHDMFQGGSTDVRSVLDPANYQLIGDTAGPITITGVTYDAGHRTAYLSSNAIAPGGYTLKVNTTVQSTDHVGLAQAYSSHFLAVSDLTTQVLLNFSNGRANAAAKTYSYNLTITNNGPTVLLAPFYLTFDGIQPNGTQVLSAISPNAQGTTWLNVGSSIPGGRLNVGQTSSVTVVTFYNPSGLKLAFKTGLLALPATTANPVIDAPPLSTIIAGQLYQSQVRAHDPNGYPLGYVLISGPAGMTVSSTTGQITWQSQATSPAAVSVVLDVYDNHGGFTPVTFTIQVAGGTHAPLIAPLPSQVFGREGQPIVLTVVATDADGRPLTFWADHVPGGASFDLSSHSLLWRPDFGQAGTYNGVTFDVSDGVTTVSTSITLLITSAPPPPQLAALPDQTVREGDHLRFTLHGSDALGRPVTYSSANLPANASLNPLTGVFDWPIAYNQAGTLTVPFTVTTEDGISTTHIVTYTILPAPAAPVFNPAQTWQVNEGQPVSFVAFAVDPHNPTFILPTRLPDGSLSPYPTTQPTVTYTVNGLPNGATFDPDTGLFSWTPGNHQNGTYHVTFTATNDGTGGPLSSSLTVPITVLIVNHAPDITPIADITMTAGQSFDQAVHVADPDGNPVTLSIGNAIAGFPLPAFLSLTDNGDGTGVVHLNPPSGNRGTYALRLFATDDGDGLGTAGVQTSRYTFIVTVQSATQVPVLYPIGDKVAVIGQPFSLTIQAAESDQDNLTFAMTGLPTAATLSTTTFYGQATLNWTPTALDAGAYNVTFTVTDTGNGTDTQPSSTSRTIRLVVRANDTAPVFPASSTAVTVAEGQLLSLPVTAFKQEGDPLTYTAQSLPPGASLDPATGLLTWTPTPGQAGGYTVPVTASDGSLSATETLNITVTHTNFVPTFVPLLPEYAREGTLVVFTVVAGDVDGDPLTYSLTNPPSNSSFDATSGDFKWTPEFGKAGDQTLHFVATDPAGATATLDVLVHVAHVIRPPVLSTPSHQATLGKPLSFFVQATDLDAGTSLSYSAVNLPGGAAIDPQSGQFTWTPGPSQAGDYIVTLDVSDGQATSAQDILIRASVQPQPPGVTIVLTPSFPAIPGQTVVVNIIAASIAPISSLTTTLNGQPLLLDSNGRATIAAGAPGEMQIVATATDQDGIVGTATATLKVRDPKDQLPPVVSFDSSVPNAVFSNPTSILGTVTDTNLDSWTLAIATPENSNFTVVAAGQSDVNDGPLYRLVSASLANGVYQLLLTARDISGRTSQTQTQIEINTATKANNNVVTDADVSVNLNGTTILIERAYDPLTRDGVGDFGAGWRFANRETELQTNLPTTGQENLGVFNPFRDGTSVYLTLPTGIRVHYKFAPVSFTVDGETFYRPGWLADAGVTYSLASVSTVLTKAGNRYYDLATGQPYNPGNPFFSGPSYTLTAPDGTRYQLDARGDITGQVTPTGAQLYISNSGITASNGQTIQFLRDAEGRITDILTPDGQLITYQYDASGNLVAMQNVNTGGSQRYGYAQSDSHLLIAAVRSNGDSVLMPAGTTNTLFIQRDLGSAIQFAGTTTNNTLAAGTNDLLSFRFDQNELNSLATGTVLLRVVVQGTDGIFVPGVPTIAGLQPLSVTARGGIVVAIFAINRPGLYVVAIAGATPQMTGNYAVNLTVAGDISGDGKVDGNDSALLAAALGSSVGSANYSLAADINGDGKADSQDQLLLDGDYGFHATPIPAPTTPPARPVFDLDVNSDSAPVGDGKTTASSVTLVGQTDPNTLVTLSQTGAVANSNANGLFVFFNVPLASGDNAYTVIATNTAGVTSQFTKIFTRIQPGFSLTPPVITASLADDTGISALDNITSDDTVTGSITAANPIASFQAQVDQSSVTDILGSLSGTSFTISPALLATINGGPLAEGKHTLTLIAKDSNGNLAQSVGVSFILITTPPVPVTPVLLASSDTGISSSDGVTRVTTPTYSVNAVAGSIVRLYAGVAQVAQATATNGPVFLKSSALADGAYAITATIEDIAGNVSTAAAPVTLVIRTGPPTAPTLGLDAASQSPAGQTTHTAKEIVNLTGKTDPGAYVALYRPFDLNSPIRKTQADATGYFSFLNVGLAPGTQAFTVVASDVAGNSSQLTQKITTTASDTSAPVITAALAHDTGLSAIDGITFDPTITGTVDDPSGVAKFQAALDGGSLVDLTALLAGGVGFTLTAANLASLNGGVALADGPHTVTLQGTDSLGHASTAVSLLFKLQAVRPLPPSNLHLIATDLTGTSISTTKSRSLTVELNAPAATIVTLYMNGAAVGQQTAPISGVLDFAIPGTLADGQYLFTANAGTVSGLESPTSSPFTATVDNATPAISSFGLDKTFETRPYGQGLTTMPMVRLAGQTVPGAIVTLVETGQLTTSDASGSFSFYPVSLPNLGSTSFTARVVDVAGNVNALTTSVTRIDNTLPSNLLPPDVAIATSETTARVGDSITLTITTQTHDGQPLASKVLLVNGQQVSISPSGTATINSATPGVFNVNVKAFDAEGNEGDATLTLTFLTPPNGLPAPTAGINEQFATPDVTKQTSIVGTANTPDLLQYTLQYSIRGLDQWKTFATGTTPVINGTLGTLDPTMMQNGYYDVRLSVEDTSGQVTTADQVYQVDGNVKIGNFTLSYPDVNIPNAGFPLTITRNYDSRQKETSGDFGFGWSLSTTNIQIAASSVLGAGFIETETQLGASSLNPLGGFGGLGGLPGLGFPGQTQRTRIQYSFQNTQNDLVTIVLPNGTKETFDMGFYGVTYNYAGPPLATTSIFFVPLPGTGTTGTLEALTNNNVIVSPAQVGPVTFIDASTGQVYNPTLFKYTDAAGTVFIVSTAHGVQSITDPNGNIDTYTASGVQSSDGRNLTIARDSQGRVTSITEPDGSQLKYGYDFYGDLVTITDAMGNVTRYTYDTDHLLQETYDPLGRQGAKNEYDDSGRLVAEVDSQGHQTSFDHVLPQNTESKTDALGNKTTYVYDDQGNVIDQIDPLGDVTENSFDTQNHVLSHTQILADGTKLTTSYTYDATGNKTSQTDPSGATTYFTYDSQGDLLTTKDPLGYVTSSTYDANGNLQSTTDANGNTTHDVTSSVGLVISQTDPMGYTSSFSYNLFGENVSAQDAAGTVYSSTYNLRGQPTSDGFVWVDPKDSNNTLNLQQTKSYDANGNQTKVVAPIGSTTQSAFDADGHLISGADRYGNWSHYVYNTTGQMIELVYPDGTVVYTVYDLLGRPSYKTDRYDPTSNVLPNAIHTVYDAAGRVILTQELSQVLIKVITTPAGNSTSVFVSASALIGQTSSVYDAAGRLLKTTDPTGLVTQYTYDADGRALTKSVGSTQTTSFQYDADGRQIEETDPSGAVTRFVYDGNGNVLETLYADGTTTSSTYDKDNRVTSFTDQGDQTTNYTYDASNHLTAVILPAVADPLNGGNMNLPEYDYTYDVYGDILTRRDPLGHVTTYVYDAYGRQISETTPDGETSSTTYNQAGLVATQTDFKGQVTATTYNSLGGPIAVSLYTGAAAFAAGTPSDTINTTYDNFERAISVTDPNSGTIQTVFDPAGEVSALVTPEGTLHYAYDPVTLQLIETSTAFTDVKYAYDNFGRLSTVSADMVNGNRLATPLTATYTYDAASNLISLKQPNGVTTTNTYDILDRLTSIKVTDLSGHVLSSDTYTLDALGHRNADDEFQLQSSGTLDEVKISWTYDALGRLVQESSVDVTGLRPDLTYTTNFSYDLVGNITQKTSMTSAGTVTTTNTYNGDDELIRSMTSSGTITTYLYDANGSLIETMVNGQVSQTYSYDLQNRLNESTAYSTNSGGQLVTTSSVYTYDPAGNLVKQVTTSSVKGLMQPPTVQIFLVDPKNGTESTQPFEVQDFEGTPIVTYIWGTQALFQVGRTGQAQYFVQDGRNSVRLLTDANGQIIARYDYGAYGDALGFNPATAATALLYAGERFDPTTDQYDLGSRTYSPSTMRFSQRDAFIGNNTDPQSLNKYSYVQGDPINLADPSGYGVDAALLGIAVHIRIGQHFLRTAYPFTAQAGGPYAGGDGAVNRTLRLIFLLTPEEQAVFDTLRGFTEGYNEGPSPLPFILPDWVLLSEEAKAYIATTATAIILNTRPDLIAFISLPPQIWEIKPIAEKAIGLVQVAGYIIAANLALLAEARVAGRPVGALFIPGLNLAPPFGYQAPALAFAGTPIPIDQSTPGLIIYDNREALKVDFEIAEATAAFSLVIGAVSIIDPLIAPLLIVVQEAIDATLDFAYETLTNAITVAAGVLGPILAFGSRVPQLGLVHLSAAGGPGPDQTVSSAVGPDLTSNDPRLPRLLAQAELAWSGAAGGSPPLSFGVVVEPLPNGLLGESTVTAWDESGRPLAGVILLSPNAAGKGWYVGSEAADSSAFRGTPASTVSVAAAGTAAFGHYDLLTTLEHEIGHILAFDPSNRGYANHLLTINGTQVFVGSGVILPVAAGGELDPVLYPGDVMAATLIPGIRKEPAANEMAVVSTLWGSHLPPLSPTDDESDPAAAVQTVVQPTLVAPAPAKAIVDYAINALAPSASAPGATSSIYDLDGYPTIVSSVHRRGGHIRKGSWLHARASDLSYNHLTVGSRPPDGGLASELSLRAAEYIAPYSASEPRASERSANGLSSKPARTVQFGSHPRVNAEALSTDHVIRARFLTPLVKHQLRRRIVES
jgi:RHS repeat-associated protein